VAFSSQLEPHSHLGATERHGFKAEHTAILADPAAFQRFATLLGQDEKLTQDPLATR